MDSLWGVIIGGALAVSGSAATQWYLLTAKSADDRRKLREQKFEQMISEIYEHSHWLETQRDIYAFGFEQPETLSPFAKLLAITVLHFPEVLPRVKEVERKAHAYKAWMLAKARDRLAGNIDKLNVGFDEAYVPYMEAKETLLDEMQAFAEKEFRPKPKVLPAVPLLSKIIAE